MLWNIVEKSLGELEEQEKMDPSLIAFHSRKQTMEKRRKSNKTHAFCQTKTTEIGVAN